VLSIPELTAEIKEIEALGYQVRDRLKISQSCPLLLPFHIALDQAKENQAAVKIGTTGRGIGPTYEDKVARRALKIADLFDTELLQKKLTTLAKYHNHTLQNFYDAPTINPHAVLEELLDLREQIRPMVTDVSAFIRDHQDLGIIFEGAQGAALDIDQGTYPFVTSSNTTIGAVSTGTGYPTTKIKDVLGIIKAYTTRVGGGPFPTEQTNYEGELLAKNGHEFGSVTGRPRRCGWLDIPMLRDGIYRNGINHLALMKIDVLDDFEQIKVCVAYEYAGKEHLYPPVTCANKLSQCKPVYRSFPGWRCKTAGTQNISELPANAQNFVKAVEELCQTKISMISTGPHINDIIILDKVYQSA